LKIPLLFSVSPKLDLKNLSFYSISTTENPPIAPIIYRQWRHWMGLTQDQLGIIELKTDCAFVGVKTNQVAKLLPKVNSVKLKEKKVRVVEV
jgi:hypothetical protein